MTTAIQHLLERLGLNLKRALVKLSTDTKDGRCETCAPTASNPTTDISNYAMNPGLRLRNDAADNNGIPVRDRTDSDSSGEHMIPRSPKRLPCPDNSWSAWWGEPEFTMEGQSDRNQTECHNNCDSLFSTSSGFDNFRGFLNLCIILLVLSNARVALENIIKYGILIDPVAYVQFIINNPFSWPCLASVFMSNIFIQIAYITEKLLSKDKLSQSFGWAIHTTNLFFMLALPAIVVIYIHPTPIFSCSVLGGYCIGFLKLVSYINVNKWCRDNYGNSKKRLERRRTQVYDNGKATLLKENTIKLVMYPDNINQKDMYYFMIVPTLCYELNFPRSARIRKRFLLKRVVEMLFLSQLMVALCHQWIVPSVNNSMVPFHNMEVSRIVERLLKLSIPNHFIWLIFFYWFFHSCLNVLAELLMFGDREFYRDWWNAETVQYFWSNWNIPVHKWATRHLYKPMLRAGYSKMQSQVVVFALSAFFHEYLVSVPLRMFRIWAFCGMLGQIPFALVVSKYTHGKYGNMAVWLSLIIGQPLAIFMYAHDYYVMNNMGLENIQVK